MGGMYRMQDLLDLLTREGAEELCLEPGRPPVMVRHGKARVMDGELVTSDNIAELFHSIATAEQKQELTRCGDSQFIHATEHSARFKVSAAFDNGQLNLTVRNLTR
jgi:Tfp pilus assembly ATPase PilU